MTKEVNVEGFVCHGSEPVQFGLQCGGIEQGAGQRSQSAGIGYCCGQCSVLHASHRRLDHGQLYTQQ